jgi:PPP family 3-phenylpropionic acid transporter
MMLRMPRSVAHRDDHRHLVWPRSAGPSAPSPSIRRAILAQTLHAATFAAFHVAAVTHTWEVFGRDRSATAQAIYSSATYGLGNILGMVGSGLLKDRLRMPSLFAAGAVAAVLGALLMAPLAKRARTAPVD